MKRSALALLAVTLSVVSLHAQMGSATGPANMMSTEVLAPAAGRGPVEVRRPSAFVLR